MNIYEKKKIVALTDQSWQSPMAQSQLTSRAKQPPPPFLKEKKNVKMIKIVRF